MPTASASVEEIGLLMGGAHGMTAAEPPQEAWPMSLKIEPRRSISWQMLYPHAAPGGGC